MSFFSKMFGTKGTDDKAAVKRVGGGDFTAALAMHLRGELEPALSTYLTISREYPENILAPFFAATISAGKGNTVEAVESLRFLSGQVSAAGDSISRAITLELVAALDGQAAIRVPAVAEVVVIFGELLKKEGFVQESAVCFEIAAGLAPANSNVLHKLGDTLHDLRMYDYAESVLLEALGNAPNHWGAMYTYAVLLQDLGRDEEAVAYYERAVKLNPTHVNCHNNYGAALLRTNRVDDALAECTVAAGLDPASPFVKINLGNIYLLKQEFETARACFTQAISLNASLAPAYCGLGSVEQAAGGSPERIKELYLKAIEINPSIAEAYHALGNVFAREGNAEALRYFSAAAQLNNNLKNLHMDFAGACLQLGRKEEALEHLKTALQQNPDDVLVQEALDRMIAEKSV